MDTVKIKWQQTNYSDVGDLYDTHYYALSRGNTLLYIGISYDQNVKKGIQQTLKRLDVNTKGLTIWLGYPDTEGTTYGRITRKIVQDVQCLMINTNQPAYNTPCKENYTGRNSLKVKTRGCPILRKCVRCENYKVYLSC